VSNQHPRITVALPSIHVTISKKPYYGFKLYSDLQFQIHAQKALLILILLDGNDRHPSLLYNFRVKITTFLDVMPYSQVGI
jgi:hypothetical protein